MATIRAIKDSSVHQIQSGQVIVDLCSVVKELVENSLDAGASSIDVRFKNHGLDSIEVQDNGNGIAPEDFETIALKHYTSKLSSYEDLTGLETFGFRGEALSSLCALSQFHIVTARAVDGPKGNKLNFEISGKLKGTSVAAAQKGTTVAVENLFRNLPVRRKELEKNIKREYGKVLALLHAYACISVGVRFAVSNQMPKGKKVVVFSTKINPSTKENIVNVFGAKTMLALVKLDLKLEMQPSKGPSTQSARSWNTQADTGSKEVQVQGHISKPIFGEGRQAPDRQMFFVNSRPCGLPQVSKAFNEVYKSFNVSQSPFIFANLIVDTNAYDINVSPDKRTILLHDQTALLESLKAALTQLFESQDQSVPQSQLATRKLPAYQPLSINRQLSAQTNSSAEPASDDEDGNAESSGQRAARRQSGTTVSLIQNWVGRDAQNRSQMLPPRTKSGVDLMDKRRIPNALASKSPDDEECSRPSKVGTNDNAPFIEDSESNDEDSGGVSEREATASERPQMSASVMTAADPTHRVGVLAQSNADPLSSPYDDLFSQRPPQLPQAVQDFNARIASQQARHAEPDKSSREESIQAMTPKVQKSAPGVVENAFDRMRPKRTPAQMAEITIGDRTVTTVIGTPASKRRRIHEPKNSQSIARFGDSPLLARGLRSFAAPGTQLAEESSDIEEPNAMSEGSDLDDEDENENDLEADLMSDENPPDASSPDVDLPDLADELSEDEHVETVEPEDAESEPLQPSSEGSDEEYLDEDDKRKREDERVARLIQEAEEAAAQPSNDNAKRASQVFRSGGTRREATLNLSKYITISSAQIKSQLLQTADNDAVDATPQDTSTLTKEELADDTAETRLSLTVTKSDFSRMHIVGQFNLGFILAVRPRHSTSSDSEDHLFIIDQHAADEKYNFERLSRTTTLTPQRLVQPKPLHLTAIEEEIILEHAAALTANGFIIDTDTSGRLPVGQRCSLLSLPTSKETTFSLADLEELLHLLSEQADVHTEGEIPRPSRVRRMLAMRACRSSVMVGKTLTFAQMRREVRNLGEMEKPWNCPHGRPTMRHLAGLGGWAGWREDGVGRTDWRGWVTGRRGGVV